MFQIERLTNDLCTELKVSAAVALHGNNSCNIDAIEDSCFASESCMYGLTAPDLDMLLYSDLAFVVTCDKSKNFCACVGTSTCKKGIPHFSHVKASNNALYIHTLCVDSKNRKHGFATDLLDKCKELSSTLYLTVATGKLGQRKDLATFFDNRCSKLCKFYEKQGFKQIDRLEKYILFKF